ncbi:MAG: winged helix-turn-helix transcriptional regulator, partial [Kiritimatiellae bacterium]|nr:winged helix-turn-helix transcriptional regulator [Kiritimatiellia bacterium]
MDTGLESLIDPQSSKTLTRQLEEGIRARIASGCWSPGDILPSRKTFAEQLGISEFVVRTAFTRLAADHVITLKPGRRCVVRSIP